MAYNAISNEAFIRASQNGVIDSYEAWVDNLLTEFTNLTNGELVEILVKRYGQDAQYGHIFSGMLASMETAGKLITVDRTCKVSGKPASGYEKNPNYAPAKQPDFEYQHSLTKALPSAVKTFNRRAAAVSKDGVKLIYDSTVKKLRDLEWALRYNNYASQADAAKDLDVIIKEIQ